MEWVEEFYRLQGEWAGSYRGEPNNWHYHYAEKLKSFLTKTPGRILELGAGGGQLSVALAEGGNDVVAIELVKEAADHARRISASGAVQVINGDFYEVELEGHFDAVVYHDGFGVGSDEDQRVLLKRISQWLAPNGVALIDIYTPWYWAKTTGQTGRLGNGTRRYAFDASGSRMLDYWSDGEGREVKQSLRCYSPADLTLLLEGTGLSLSEIIPTGGFDYQAMVMRYDADLLHSHSYLAVLIPTL